MAFISNFQTTYRDSLFGFKPFLFSKFEVGPNNTFVDRISGNSIFMRNASARTGNGANLDYTITGLLTSDTIEVVTGSDTPTIPVDGTLRIGSIQTVYGVTIKRGGDVWAIIPFCEPYAWTENLPTISYDVSGNSNHAVCATLASGNITTQNDYFYLQNYGYNETKGQLLDWDFSSWSGVFPDDVPAGVDLVQNQTATSYITEASGRCRYVRGDTTNPRMTEYSICTIGKKYRLRINIISYNGSSNTGLKPQSGTAIGVINTVGWYYEEYVATAENFFIYSGNTLNTMDIVFQEPILEELGIVPALMDGSADALGNEIQFTPSMGWLRYACDIAMTDSVDLKTVDAKGRLSHLLDSGKCVNGLTYLVESTETDHFGAGVSVHDTFVSGGTETLDHNNTVREIYEVGGESGFFFTEAGVRNDISFDEIHHIQPHYFYCEKPLYPYLDWNNTQIIKGNISKIIMFSSTKYVSDSERFKIINWFKIPESNKSLITFIWDHPGTFVTNTVIPLFGAKSFPEVHAVNLNGAWTDAYISGRNDVGDEIAIHTPKIMPANSYLPEYQGFSEDATNYNDKNLRVYYEACKDYYKSSINLSTVTKVYPGGNYDEITLRNILDFFNVGIAASGSVGLNKIPFDYSKVGRYTMDGAGYNTWVGYVDSCITNGGWLIFYGHPETWGATLYDADGNSGSGKIISDWLSDLLDYIETQISSGDKVRVVTAKRAVDLIQSDAINY